MQLRLDKLALLLEVGDMADSGGEKTHGTLYMKLSHGGVFFLEYGNSHSFASAFPACIVERGH